jgi:hypothetical protein
VISWIKNLFKKPPRLTDKVKIWGVIEGPVLGADIPDCYFPDEAAGLILKVSNGKDVFEAEFWFDNLDEAYKIVRHFHSKIEPIELNMKEFELVKDSSRNP